MKKLPYGISDYKELREKDYYYVDKTNYLKNLEKMSEKLMYLRPRRFGKTLFTSMMYYYYDIKSKDKFEELFKDTYIHDKPTDLRNSYYVLKFDFSGMSNIDVNDKKDIEYKFRNIVESSIKKFLNYYELECNIKYDDRDSSADILMKFFVGLKLDRKIYIIIDEYDNFTNAILHGNADVFKSVLGKNGFIKDFYARIKENCGTIVDRVFITGVCSISLDAMTSGFNIATNITNHISFNAMTALTHEEVKKMIEDIDENERENIFNIMLDNYDGYKFNNDAEEKVFNPTLVMYFLSNYYEFNKIPDELFDKNIISSYEQIKNIITIKDNEYYKNILDNIFNNKSIDGNLVTNFDVNMDITKDIITSFLYYFGYMTIDSIYDPAINSYKYVIPNKVIDLVFNDYLLAILKEDNIRFDNSIIMECEKEMKEYGKIDKLSNYIASLLKSSGNRVLEKFDEKYIQLVYYAILRPRNTYNTYMEYPSNDGYIDLMLFKNNVNAKYDIMVEFKYIKKKEFKNKLLKDTRIKAINQINKYLLDDRIDKSNLKKYIVIFVGNELKLLEEVI